MSLQYVKSQKGRDQLLYKGYLHRKQRTSAGKILWKCADYQKHHCTGKVHTHDGQVIKSFPHSHPPSETTGKNKRRPCGAKKMVASQESTHKVTVTPSCEEPQRAIANKKPFSQNNPKQTIQRLRACLNAVRKSTSGLRTPIPAKTAAEEPPSAPPQTSGCPESSREEAIEGSFKATSLPTEETRTCRPTLTWDHQEASRLRFRTSTIPPGKAPQEILTGLSEAAQQWLCPQERSKEWIVDMIIMEQFLDVLPVDMRTWLRAREPGSSKEAAELAGAYFKECQPDRAIQDQVTFEDVSVSFTTDEWALLNCGEKSLYWNVMHQNYDSVASLADGVLNGKNEEVDSWRETPEPLVELSAKRGAFPLCPEEELIVENCLERRQKDNLGKEEHFVSFKEGLRETVRDTLHPDASLREEPCSDYEKQGGSTTLLDHQKSSSEEDPQLLILPRELHEISEQKNLQNLEPSSVEEGQNSMEEQHSNHLETEEEKSIIFTKWLWEPLLQDVGPGEEALFIVIDGADPEESLTLVSNEKIHSEEDSRCLVLPEEPLEMSEEGISQSSEQDTLPVAGHVSSKLSPTALKENADLTSGTQEENDGRSYQASHAESEGHQDKPILFGNTSGDLTKEMIHPIVQSDPEIQHTYIDCGNQEEISKHINSQKTTDGEDQKTYLKCEKLFPQNFRELRCSESGENSVVFPTSTELKKNGGKGKYFNRRSTCVKPVLRAHKKTHPRWKFQNWENQSCYRSCNYRLLERAKGLRETRQYCPLKPYIQTCEASHLPMETARFSLETESSSSDSKGLESQQRTSFPPFLNKMAAEPSLAHLISVLQQVAEDTAEIKSAVSSLHTTVTDIQNTLGGLSGCTDEAERRISNLEDTSRNTKTQLVQHCSDLKAIEAKLGGKAFQTNVIAGLWSSLKINRGASPLNLSPNS